MVDTADAFFKANQEVESRRKRRANHVEGAQKRHAEALLRFTLFTEELDGLVAVRKEARGKANEAHCWQSAAEGEDKALEKMLETF